MRKIRWFLPIVVIVVVIMIAWVPLVWGDQIVIDKAQFATFYYTAMANLVLDVAKIAFGFWLANFYFHKIRLNQAKNSWKHAISSLKENCETLLEVDFGSKEYQRQRHILNELYNGLCQAKTKMDAVAFLSDSIEPVVDVLIKSQLNEYRENTRNGLKRLCSLFKQEEITIGKPLTDEQKEIVNDIREHVDRWLREIIS